jgi:mycothiol synthase
METKIIRPENVPEIPGLVFRHFRGAEDFPLMVPVAVASATADGEDNIATVETVTKQYESDYSLDPGRDMIMVEVAGELVGYFRCWWYAELGDTSRSYVSWGCLLPQWRRKGIGTCTQAWLEARQREIAAGHPAACGKVHQAGHIDAQHGKAALLAKFGYKPWRGGHEMLRPSLDDIPDFPLPDGLELRPVTPDHYRAIWDAAEEAMRDHAGVEEPDERDYQNWLTDPYVFQPQLWQVAWDAGGDEIAGQVRTFILAEENVKYNRKRGYTEFISVRRPWRRRGLARALIVRSLAVQKAAGMMESMLGVDSRNTSDANRIYRTCGFQVMTSNYLLRKVM